MRLRKGDRVQVLAGKDRGKTGDVIRVMPTENKVIVAGVNISKRHTRPTRATTQGGIIDKDMPLPASAVAIVCSKCGPSRIGYEIDADGEKFSAYLQEVWRHGYERDGDDQSSGRASRSAYVDEIREQLRTSLGLKNVMEVPRLEKIVLNIGVGRAIAQQSLLDGAVRDLETITGQHAVVTRARKSVAGFKLREGNAIGTMVTLRGDRMWEFFDRLISVAIPRIRDFRGLSPRSFDGRGNYTFGITEQLIFPEIDYDKVDATRGMDITLVTSARSDAEGRAFLDAFGFPFRREGQ